MFRRVSGLVALGLATPLAAQQPAANCVAMAPRPLLPAAADRAGLADAALAAGRPVEARLVPTGKVAYAVAPEKPGAPESYGGMFSLAVAEAGTYRVALGAGAWIDMVKGEKVVASTNHGHGDPCAGARKMVDFPLTPGDYVLEVSGNKEAALALSVTRLP